ncbi:MULTISPECIES: cation:proton antiporter [Rhodococcus]|uniref:Sodium/proton antiporter n=1 Tax=Rhodococcus pyridinivorans AK37 TaxID=1114960 RepID=H0JY14_9NOCA|nr:MULTISPECIES: cation:proton antiporter [Rhodococcus]EHK80652.1 sodium/proton antiporter [Rhodococcus pyridinivorans AK37]MCD2139393.1 cation:proton antiporter [Rhodococcus pyridinivorans]MCW3470208.1 cation:proton antiporter [Rhodococcus pyridinivorans]QXU52271.1 cation:proton antiporter [Rhodococcus sp. LW-XY12]UPK65049.1 cation:proton antiporter [Rhodococcus pyridinivorans]
MDAAVATSLFWIAVAAVLAPLIAGAVPRRLVPEVVLLLVTGVLIGPYAFDLAETGSEIGILRELGLGMLFLLAGYEIDPAELRGRGGRRAMLTWCVCMLLALGTVAALGAVGQVHAEIAVAIALTSTALGTLLPILADRGLVATPLGRSVLNHGAFGELLPVVAMATLLGARGALGSLIVLLAFAVVAVAVAVLPTWILREGSRFTQFVRLGSDTTAQIPVRLTMLLLVGLIAVAAVFDLDIILGAFAAGFILRRTIPAGDERLEKKLDGLGYGFLIPIFFVTSGMAIDVGAVVSAPGILLAFLGLLVLVRGVPVFVASRLERDETGKRMFGTAEQLQIALYSTTGLPLIVAVTGVAVSADQMSNASASILVAAGAVTVLVLPMLAGLLHHPAAVETPERA